MTRSERTSGIGAALFLAPLRWFRVNSEVRGQAEPAEGRTSRSPIAAVSCLPFVTRCQVDFLSYFHRPFRLRCFFPCDRCLRLACGFLVYGSRGALAKARGGLERLICAKATGLDVNFCRKCGFVLCRNAGSHIVFRTWFCEPEKTEVFRRRVLNRVE